MVKRIITLSRILTKISKNCYKIINLLHNTLNIQGLEMRMEMYKGPMQRENDTGHCGIM